MPRLLLVAAVVVGCDDGTNLVGACDVTGDAAVTGGSQSGGARGSGGRGTGGGEPADSGGADVRPDAGSAGGGQDAGSGGNAGASGGADAAAGGTSGSGGAGGSETGGSRADAGTAQGGAVDAGALLDTCSNGTTDGDETDLDCGGSCAPCGLGAGCGYNWDCSPDGPGCDAALGGCACDAISHVCVASHCVDRRRDGAESDVDCGGQCAGCGLGGICYHDADCSISAPGCNTCACDRQTSTCVESHCSDHRVDADEPSVDCGGADCARCPWGAGCKADSDCTPGGCDSLKLICTSTCYDHHQDSDETDVDCGGTSCNGCFAGQKCLRNFDCVSGHFCNGSHVCQ